MLTLLLSVLLDVPVNGTVEMTDSIVLYCTLSTDLQRQIGEREDQLQAMYSDPELQKVFPVVHCRSTANRRILRKLSRYHKHKSA